MHVIETNCYLFKMRLFLFFRKINKSFGFCFSLYPGFLFNIFAYMFSVPFICNEPSFPIA
jgi:hypothetical protein